MQKWFLESHKIVKKFEDDIFSSFSSALINHSDHPEEPSNVSG